MDDYVTVSLVVASAFFVALSLGLLLRYRQVSRQINSSSDLGRDLWGALERRMKKQDERILDLMVRFDVVQARVMSQQPPLETQSPPSTSSPVTFDVAPKDSNPVMPASADSESREVSQSRSQMPVSPPLQTPVEIALDLDRTELLAIGLLDGAPKNTREITNGLRLSREHTARVMKRLFELGLVKRNDASKPFVYELTEAGRRHLSTRE